MGATCIVQTYRNSYKFFSESNKKKKRIIIIIIGYGYLKNSGERSRAMLALLFSKFYADKGVFPDSFSFSIVSEPQILKYLNNLSVNKATGLDEIPCRFIEDGAPIIVGPVTHIINLSLIQGVVPDDFKSARVVPLFKNNDNTVVGNYRPVSILNVLSENFERVVYDQVEYHFREKN